MLLLKKTKEKFEELKETAHDLKDKAGEKFEEFKDKAVDLKDKAAEKKQKKSLKNLKKKLLI